MASTSGYLTLSPSTSTTRSILAEPLEQIPQTLEQIREPLEQNQAPSEQSQEAQESGSALENSTWSEEIIEKIVELKRTKTSWPEIGEAVGLPHDTCIKFWVDFCRRPVPATGRQNKAWDKSEIDLLLSLRRVDYKWLEIAALLDGRTENSCRLRYHRLREEAKKQGMDQRMYNEWNWDD